MLRDNELPKRTAKIVEQGKASQEAVDVMIENAMGVIEVCR